MIFGVFNQIATIIPLFSFSYFLFVHYQCMCLSYLFKNTGHPSFMVPIATKAGNKCFDIFFIMGIRGLTFHVKSLQAGNSHEI